jgi:hypothetical protein
MHESETYQAVMDEGAERQVKKDILRLGQKKLGAADTSMTTKLEGISDLERLNRIHDRLFEATTWQDLLDTP